MIVYIVLFLKGRKGGKKTKRKRKKKKKKAKAKRRNKNQCKERGDKKSEKPLAKIIKKRRVLAPILELSTNPLLCSIRSVEELFDKMKKIWRQSPPRTVHGGPHGSW